MNFQKYASKQMICKHLLLPSASLFFLNICVENLQ